MFYHSTHDMNTVLYQGLNHAEGHNTEDKLNYYQSSLMQSYCYIYPLHVQLMILCHCLKFNHTFITEFLLA